jgi:basic membrane protein A and related proteins
LKNWLILTIVMLGLAACSQSSDCFQAEVFCAALVTDTQGIDDHGMNQDTWAGLAQAQADGIVDRAEYISSIDSRDYEKNIAYFVERGFDVIVTVGPGLRDETLLAAELKPFDPVPGESEVTPIFVGINQSGDESHPNFMTITFAEDQMGFLAGVLAARISKTQVVGAVCETSGIDSMWRYCEGFRAGTIFSNPLTGQNVKALVVYREDGDREKIFVDEDWGRDTANSLIQRGADVIFAAGGITGQGALRAADEAEVNSIGTERNQGAALARSGSGVVTSILGDASFEIQKVLRLIREGRVQELQSGQIKYIPLDQTFPESLTQELDSLVSALQTGEVKTNVTLLKP